MSQIQTKQTRQRKKHSSVLCHRCSPRCIILIIIVVRMMVLEELLEVQLVLLHTLVDGVHF
jgi:hypothetical protein